MPAGECSLQPSPRLNRSRRRWWAFVACLGRRFSPVSFNFIWDGS